MSCSVTVLYPNDEDATFDLPYYMTTHMPMVQDAWGERGLKSWQVVRLEDGINGARSQYSVQATMLWESAEHARAVIGAKEYQYIFDDIAKFTNKMPTLIMGDLVEDDKPKA